MNPRYVNCYIYRKDNSIILQIIDFTKRENSLFARIVSYAGTGMFNIVQIFKIAMKRLDEPEILDMIDLSGGLHEILNELDRYIHTRLDLGETLETIGINLCTEITPYIDKAYTALDWYNNQYVSVNLSRIGPIVNSNRHNFTIQDDTNPNNQYDISEYEIVLRPENLFEHLVCLDNTKHCAELSAKQNGTKTHFKFIAGSPKVNKYGDLVPYNYQTDEPAFLRDITFVDSLLNVPGNQNSFWSEFVAKEIVREVKENESDLADYKEITQALDKMLNESPNKSLAYAIYNELYPPVDFEAYERSQHISQPELRAVLDPKIAHQKATKQVITFLRRVLRENPNTGKSEQSIFRKKAVLVRNKLKGVFEQGTRPVQNGTPATRHIDSWFRQLNDAQATLWDNYLTTLCGKPAHDGGFYTARYTEITLLRECSLRIDSSGLMELVLDKKNSSSYDNYYAKDKSNHSILEDELRFALAKLGLCLKDGLDVHEKILLDGPSSRKLMDMGFHIDKQYCQKLMKERITYRVLSSKEGENKNSPYHLLPTDLKLKIAKIAEPHTHQRDLIATLNSKAPGSNFALDQYLAHIGLGGLKPEINLKTLMKICSHHLRAFPYQNTQLYEEGKKPVEDRIVPSINGNDVYNKMVTQGISSYCFQSATLLYEVLHRVGFNVTEHLSKVVLAHEDQIDERLIENKPHTHSVLVVTLGESRYLLDPGFSNESLLVPLKIKEGRQKCDGRKYRLDDLHGIWRLFAKDNTAEKSGYLCLYQFNKQQDLQNSIDSAHVGLYKADNVPIRADKLLFADVTPTERNYAMWNKKEAFGIFKSVTRDGKVVKQTLENEAQVKQVAKDKFKIKIG